MDDMKIVIDGKECHGKPGQTILDVAKENGISIPTFCYDKRVEIYGACGICVVEVEGNPKMVKSCATLITENMVVKTNTERVFESRKTNLELLLSNHVGDCRPPCVHGCPAGTDCQGYVGLIANGQYREAVELIKKRIPLPGCIGRVCPHPCEDNCRRKLVDEAVSIAWLKRFAADMDLEDPFIPEVPSESGKSVAVIGGGPFGLSVAYYLRQKGHAITVFEAMPHFGGMLRYGIPEYRLPKEVVDGEVAQLEKMGIVLKPNTQIGRDISFEELRKQYDAVALGIGAWISTGVGCIGEDADGVIGGIDFLRKVIRNEETGVGQTIAVVGGGNTAMDACRTAIRMGKKVYNIYRRTKDEMPADRIEIEEGEEEGVIFKNLTNPLEIIKDDKGHVKQIKLQIMELGEPDESGRRAPVPVPGKTETLDVDNVILAIGQAVDSSFFSGIDLTRKKGIAYDADTFMTSLEGVFAGGDCGNDKISIAVEAIGDAVKAVEVIHAYLNGEKIAYREPYVVKRDDISEKTFEDRERQCRPTMEHLLPEVRKDNFAEIVAGYPPILAEEEGSRCLECGCGKYHECKLYDFANEYDVKPERIAGEINRIEFKDDHPYVMRDPNKCILCGLCVRVCSEVVGSTALGLVDRGFDTTVQPALMEPLAESGCISCGNCISVCPVGALLPKVTHRKPIPLETKKVRTTCPNCGVGCQMDLKVCGSRIVGIEPAFGEANQGILCVKGKFAYDYIEDPQRLKMPLVRKNGVLEEVSWKEALDFTAIRLSEIKKEYGPNAIAGLSSTRMTNEESYLFQKFMRSAIGTNNVDRCGRLNHENTVIGLTTTMGFGTMTNSLSEVAHAEAILVMGANAVEGHPVLAMRIGEAVRKGAKLVVIDPIKTTLAKQADVFLQIKPGTNVCAINGLLHTIVSEGLADENYILEKTEGYAELKQLVTEYNPERVAEICEIDAEEIRKAARIYAKANSAPIYYAMDVTQFSAGTIGVMNASNLALICGKIGREGCGVNTLRGQSNGQGASDMGIIPGRFTDFQSISDSAAYQKFSEAWGVKLSRDPGLSISDTNTAILEGRVKAVYLVDEDPMISDPVVSRVENTLKKCDFLIVQDIFLTKTAKLADVVFPTLCYAEKDGTYTSTERRVQRIRKAVNGPGEAKNDWEIFHELMKRFGMDCGYRSAEAIFNEMRTLTPSYAGISYARLDKLGSLQWPCPTVNHPGTPYLYETGFKKGGKALLMPTHHKNHIADSNPQYPFLFVTGHVMTERRSKEREEKKTTLPGVFQINLNPKAAERLNICDGEKVLLESQTGSMVVEVICTDDVLENVVFMPVTLDDCCYEGTVLEGKGKSPDFNEDAVRITKLK
ncbi:MAG: formate dehydrogenase subunit alpha [Eubacteriales bacterium]|nr:formate dehydrogenase subunit alpha [Eubacteriales bacterium]MDD3349696.1 formate dehydrogenase subunit alpha [Eubacteriales bacterium]